MLKKTHKKSLSYLYHCINEDFGAGINCRILWTLQSPEYDLITDTQDRHAVMAFLGYDTTRELGDMPTALLVKARDGDYEDVWATWSIRPCELEAMYFRIHPRGR